MSCLSWAAGRGHLEVVKSLLLKGARANSADKVSVWGVYGGGGDPLSDHLEVVKSLLLKWPGLIR